MRGGEIAKTVRTQAEHTVVLEAMEAQRCAALVEGDVHAIGELLSDDLVHVHGGGSVEDRAAYLAGIAAKFIFHKIERGPLKIRVFSEVAIMTGELKQIVTVRGSGETLELGGPTTQTWILTQDGWRQNTCHNHFINVAKIAAPYVGESSARRLW
jgi:Domain of unknown function (DUF4440)